MHLLVESLKAVDGTLDDLIPHIDRMNRSCRRLFGCEGPDLKAALEGARDSPGPGTWKIRVIYDSEIRKVEASPYIPKKYGSAVLVDGGEIDYSCKSVDRPALDALTERARKAGGDTALVVKNGLVTDFSYANAAFFDGSTWWTPALPLLEGTRRARLLAAGTLMTANIRPEDIRDFVCVSPINAMLDLDEVSMPSENIIPEKTKRSVR